MLDNPAYTCIHVYVSQEVAVQSPLVHITYFATKNTIDIKMRIDVCKLHMIYEFHKLYKLIRQKSNIYPM